MKYRIRGDEVKNDNGSMIFPITVYTDKGEVDHYTNVIIKSKFVQDLQKLGEAEWVKARDKIIRSRLLEQINQKTDLFDLNPQERLEMITADPKPIAPE